MDPLPVVAIVAMFLIAVIALAILAPNGTANVAITMLCNVVLKWLGYNTTTLSRKKPVKTKQQRGRTATATNRDHSP